MNNSNLDYYKKFFKKISITNNYVFESNYFSFTDHFSKGELVGLYYVNESSNSNNYIYLFYAFTLYNYLLTFLKGLSA